MRHDWAIQLQSVALDVSTSTPKVPYDLYLYARLLNCYKYHLASLHDLD